MKKFLFFFIISFLLIFFYVFKISLSKKLQTGFINNTSPENQTPEFITIIFAGDLMFDRYIRQIAQAKGNDFILQNIKNTLLNSDLVVTNLEGSITNFNSISMGTKIGSRNNYIFTFDQNLTKTLKQHNILLVNIGNNHILNFGQAGLEQTKTNLKKENIAYFGNTGTNQNNRSYIYQNKNFKIGFVNYNQFVESGKISAISDIEKLRNKVDLLIVYTHWGIEYQTIANKHIQNLAHEFIDKGADLVIGSHPHVMQQAEVYKGKTIYYSLGNFVFDQYFSKETQKGLLLKTKINTKTKNIEFEEIKIKLESNGQTKLSSD